MAHTHAEFLGMLNNGYITEAVDAYSSDCASLSHDQQAFVAALLDWADVVWRDGFRSVPVKVKAKHG